MAISLSDYLGINKKLLDDEGCFDTILDLDSLMFVNFLRVRDSETPEIVGAYEHISRLFESIGQLLRVSKGYDDRFWREASNRLAMAEFEEICLGYSRNGTAGAGSGNRLKLKILTAGKEIITAGIKEPQIFELVGLFEDDIGPDRISDFIARAISDYLKSFSIRVLNNIGVNPKTWPNIRFSDGLIVNPFNLKRLFLLPKDLLHELPVAHEWEDISIVCQINDRVRREINKQIGEKWKEMTISERKEAARRILLNNPRLMQYLVKDYKEFSLDAYNFSKDPLGESIWYQAVKDFSARYPLNIEKKPITSLLDIQEMVLIICNKYKELIETNGLSELLYTDEKEPRKERIAQRLFFGIAESYCESNGLDISPETNSGRGAVDFKFSIGYDLRVIVEIKLTTNKNLLHGYETQIREYKKAEGTKHAIYLGSVCKIRNSY